MPDLITREAFLEALNTNVAKTSEQDRISALEVRSTLLDAYDTLAGAGGNQFKGRF